MNISPCLKPCAVQNSGKADLALWCEVMPGTSLERALSQAFLLTGLMGCPIKFSLNGRLYMADEKLLADAAFIGPDR